MIIGSILLLILFTTASQSTPECGSDKECDVQWPEATCRNKRCSCPQNSIRRPSESRGWVCLSLQDAVTGQLGPPLTCPLPFGAGYRVVLKDENSTVIFCHTRKNASVCGERFECIRAIGTFSTEWDGICCPRKESSCDPASTNDGGWLARWFWNGTECTAFKWNPETASSANVFMTKKHCESYCKDVE